MSENKARILRFPDRRRPVTQHTGRRIAHEFLDRPVAERSDEFIRGCLSEPETLLAICTLMKDRRNTAPSQIADEAARIHDWFAAGDPAVGVFDERDYFLGELAFLAGSSCRLLGKRDEANRWLDRSEANFRHTINPAPLLANLAYERLALDYEMRRYDRVLDLLPSLTASFEKLGMKHEVLKCRFLKAASLKDTARREEACQGLEDLRMEPTLAGDPTLRGLVLANLGEVLAARGRHAEAVSAYKEALAIESQVHQPLVKAHLKVAIAENLREQGILESAVDAYREATRDYADIGMQTWVAYTRILAAETLIACSRHREAEWEILAALPTIEEQRMTPEGLAAVGLLRESVHRRNADPTALRELREHLKARA